MHPSLFLGILINSLLKVIVNVDCPTGKNKTIGTCYKTVKDEYAASLLPQGVSDHCVVYRHPALQRLLEIEKPQKQAVKRWINDNILVLQGCFNCTLWEVFKSPDISDQIIAVSDYIHVCIDSVMPT